MYIRLRTDLTTEEVAGTPPNLLEVASGISSCEAAELAADMLINGVPSSYYEPALKLLRDRHTDYVFAECEDIYNYSADYYHRMTPDEVEAYMLTYDTYRLADLSHSDHVDMPESGRDSTFRISIECMRSGRVYVPSLAPYTILDAERFELASLPDNREDAPTWSSQLTHRIPMDSMYIAEQLRVRYAFFTPPTDGLLNVVLDSFIPKLMYQSGMDIRRMQNNYKPSKTAVCISPWFASMLGVKQVPITDLVGLLGYDVKSLRLLFKQVRAKKLELVLIGYGGTSINTITWLIEIAKLTNASQPFNNISIFENDDLEISNLLRFPIDPRTSTSTYGNNHGRLSKLELLPQDISRLCVSSTSSQNYFDAATSLGTVPANKVYYGAPDIATREALSARGNFISATHANQSCRIDLNPAQNQSLQVESYGVISLATFFMNQLKMAISLMEILASDQDLTEQDRTLLEYAFDGGSEQLNSVSRTYNFQLSHTGLVSTEAEGAL